MRAIYVGQGDCTAVRADDAAGARYVVLYIDVGGGCGKCKATHPDEPGHPKASSGPLHFDTTQDPKVVLSHWHKDHYFAATKQADLTKLEWLVPRQKIGPQCAKLVRKISPIFCFPAGASHRRFTLTSDTDLYVERVGNGLTTAQAGDKNLTGLAFTLIRKNANGGDEQRIVMTGDAPYQFVVSLATKSPPLGDVVGLFAFHHGSRTHLTAQTESVMPPSTAGRDRIVFTYGLDAGNKNNFHHPAKKALSIYHKRSWDARHNTASVKPSSTAERDRGHDATTAGERDIKFY